MRSWCIFAKSLGENKGKGQENKGNDGDTRANDGKQGQIARNEGKQRETMRQTAQANESNRKTPRDYSKRLMRIVAANEGNNSSKSTKKY